MLHNEHLSPILNVRKSSIDFNAILNDRKLLILNVGKAEIGLLSARMLGMIVVARLLTAAMRRVKLPAAKRHPFFLYIDEFQNFTTDSIFEMAAEGRKFGIALHLANQSLAQMNADRRDTLLGSISTVLTFRLGPTDAEFISPYVGPRFSSRDLLEIPNYWAIARLSTRAGVTHPFAFQAADPVPPRDDQRVERIRRICQERQAAVYAAGKPISTACVAQSEVDETSDEKTEFNVVLARVGAHKLIVIRIIREVSGLGLEAAAKLAANAPTAIKEGVSRLEAKNIEERFAKAGAIVEIRLADSQRN